MVCSGILFTHHRIESMMIGNEFNIGEGSELGDLPILGIHQIVINKQAVKTYTPYGNQKSYYLPTGMQGPMVTLTCSVDDIEPWEDVYTNDYLTIKEFGYPTYNRTLEVGSDWWVDTITDDAKMGYIKEGNIRYGLTLELYKRTVG